MSFNKGWVPSVQLVPSRYVSRPVSGAYRNGSAARAAEANVKTWKLGRILLRGFLESATVWGERVVKDGRSSWRPGSILGRWCRFIGSTSISPKDERIVSYTYLTNTGL